jgi:hypothetical protein
MKTQRALSLPPIAAALLLSTLLGTAVSPAQNAQPTRPIVSIDFDGGSLEDFVEEIRGAGQNINILIPPEAAEVSVPAVALKSVGVEAALEAVAAITLSDSVSVGVSTMLGAGVPIYAVRVNFSSNTRRSGFENVDVRVISISSLTQSLPGDPEPARITTSAETILTAIDTGMEVVGGERATIKYHEDSGLLFVKGTRTQLNITERIIGNMVSDLEQRRDSARQGR